ncbi:MAG: gluconeogenesis factor YvcK family protein [Patescibacteria group bacterium]
MRNKNVVTIGGGTGSFMLLSGLKKYPVNISAIISMADDGGSTGVLRDELGVLPPGDVRQCLVALSDSSEELRDLMNYRFENGGLGGHSFGNIFLSALEKINGSFSKGIEKAIKILNVKGEVIPVTDENMRLFIKLKNGKMIKGENELDHNREISKIGIRKVFLEPKVKANKKALERIKNADLIAIGPGDFYGSIIPNLLVGGICEAIKKSKAEVVFNCNLTNKKGQTENFNLDSYVLEINKYIGKNRINYATFNTKKPSADLIRKYEKQEGKGMVVAFNEKNNAKRKFKVVRADILDEKIIKNDRKDAIASTRSFIRHDPYKLAKILMILSELGDYENVIKEIV